MTNVVSHVPSSSSVFGSVPAEIARQTAPGAGSPAASSMYSYLKKAKLGISAVPWIETLPERSLPSVGNVSVADGFWHPLESRTASGRAVAGRAGSHPAGGGGGA